MVLMVTVFGSTLKAQINTDTLQLLYGHIERESYDSAENLLLTYEVAHPNHPESGVWRAKVLFYKGERKAARNLFQSLVKEYPYNIPIRLSYTDFLLDISYYEEALLQIDTILYLQPSNTEAVLLKAKLYTWEGNYKKANKLLLQNQEAGNSRMGKQLEENVLFASAPELNAQFGFSEDNQVIATGGIALNYLRAISAKFNPGIFLANNNYNSGFGYSSLNKLQASASNNFFFPATLLYLKAKAGIYVNFINNSQSAVFIGGIALKKLFIPYFTLELSTERKPYLSNINSIADVITQWESQVVFGFNYKDNWIGNAGYLRNGFDDNNAVHTIYIWGLKRIYKNKTIELKGGYGFNYSNSDETRFIPEDFQNTIWQVEGEYNPYFTPLNQTIHSLLFTGIFKVTKRLSATAKVSYGVFANAQIPYLYYNRNTAGNLIVESGTSPMQFHPYDISVKFNLKQNSFIGYDFGYDYTINNFYTFQYAYFSAKILFAYEK